MKKTMLLFALLLAGISSVAQAVLKGAVCFLNSNNSPAVGINIHASGAKAVQTDEKGLFELTFPGKKIGDTVAVFVGSQDYTGQALEVVNDAIPVQT